VNLDRLVGRPVTYALDRLAEAAAAPAEATTTIVPTAPRATAAPCRSTTTQLVPQRGGPLEDDPVAVWMTTTSLLHKDPAGRDLSASWI